MDVYPFWWIVFSVESVLKGKSSRRSQRWKNGVNLQQRVHDSNKRMNAKRLFGLRTCGERNSHELDIEKEIWNEAGSADV